MRDEEMFWLVVIGALAMIYALAEYGIPSALAVVERMALR